MGAADDRLEARLRALRLDDPHGAAEQPRAEDVGFDTDPLVLDKEELEMLQTFHRSFNLPGLRYGLVTPVAKEDYYPPDEAEASAAQRQAVQAQARTSDLLRQASTLLGGDDEPVEAIEEEIADEADAQSDLLRWMAQPNAAPPPQQRPPRFQVSSSAVPVRTESRPRTGGSRPNTGGSRGALRR